MVKHDFKVKQNGKGGQSRTVKGDIIESQISIPFFRWQGIGTNPDEMLDQLHRHAISFHLLLL